MIRYRLTTVGSVGLKRKFRIVFTAAYIKLSKLQNTHTPSDRGVAHNTVNLTITPAKIVNYYLYLKPL